MNLKYLNFGVWCGVAFFFLFWIACFNFAQFVPPHNPMMTGEQLLAQYSENAFGIRVGMSVAYVAAVLLVPWSAAVAVELARIENTRFPIMAITSFGGGVVNSVAFLLPFIFWSAAVYRLDRDPAIVQVFNDMAWLEFVMLFAPFNCQILALAVVGLSDKSPTPTFPRWFCFLSIWVAMLVVPGGLAIFFQKGPFAWNGIIAFWLPVTVFTAYYFVLFPLMFRAVKRYKTDPALAAAIA